MSLLQGRILLLRLWWLTGNCQICIKSSILPSPSCEIFGKPLDIFINQFHTCEMSSPHLFLLFGLFRLEALETTLCFFHALAQYLAQWNRGHQATGGSQPSPGGSSTLESAVGREYLSFCHAGWTKHEHMYFQWASVQELVVYTSQVRLHAVLKVHKKVNTLLPSKHMK